MSWSDADYFRNRAEAEREVAVASANPIAAEVHLHLAELYELRAGEDRRPSLRPVPSNETTIRDRSGSSAEPFAASSMTGSSRD